MIASSFSDTHLDQLGQIIGFGPDDIAANRQGKLTARQIRRLRFDQRRTMWPSLIAWSILGALVGTLALMNLNQGLVWLAPLLVIAALAAYFAYDLRTMQSSLQGERVKSVILDVDRLPEVLHRLSVIEFQVDSLWFTASRDLESTWKAHHRYRLFYVPEVISYPYGGLRMKVHQTNYRMGGAYRILSMEPTGQAAPGKAKHR